MSHQSPDSLPSPLPSSPATPILRPIFLVRFVFRPYLPPAAQSLPQRCAPPVILSFHPSPPVFPAPSSYLLSPLLLHHPWRLSSYRCTNLLRQWIVSKIIPVAEYSVLGGTSDRSDVMGKAVGVETVLLGYTHSQRRVNTGNKKQLNSLQSNTSASNNDSEITAFSRAGALIKAKQWINWITCNCSYFLHV